MNTKLLRSAELDAFAAEKIFKEAQEAVEASLAELKAQVLFQFSLCGPCHLYSLRSLSLESGACDIFWACVGGCIQKQNDGIRSKIGDRRYDVPKTVLSTVLLIFVHFLGLVQRSKAKNELAQLKQGLLGFFVHLFFCTCVL